LLINNNFCLTFAEHLPPITSFATDYFKTSNLKNSSGHAFVFNPILGVDDFEEYHYKDIPINSLSNNGNKTKNKYYIFS